jgi:hypothetical protein
LYLADVNTALHEAGHLAGALFCGVPAEARIGFDGTSSGRTNLDLRGASLEANLFITYAGIVVVEKFHLRRAGLVFDLADIDKALLTLPAAEAVILRDKVRHDVETFVQDHELWIFKLAVALIERRYLDEETAKKVFAGQMFVAVLEGFRDALAFMPRAVWL